MLSEQEHSKNIWDAFSNTYSSMQYRGASLNKPNGPFVTGYTDTISDLYKIKRNPRYPAI
jgi:hypothetical protein